MSITINSKYPKYLTLDSIPNFEELTFELFDSKGIPVDFRVVASSISDELVILAGNVDKSNFVNLADFYAEEAKHLFQVGETYTLKISNGFTATATIVKQPAMAKPSISGFGSKLLKINFEHPVRNLDHISTINISDPNATYAKAHALSNFYIKFFDEDQNRSNDPSPTWAGYIITSTKDGYPIFDVKVSDDYRSLIVQFTAKSLPVNDISGTHPHHLQIASSKAISLLGNEILRDFASTEGNEIPLSELPFNFYPSPYAAEATDFEIVSKNKVKIKFSHDIALDPANPGSAFKPNLDYNEVCLPAPSALSVTTLSEILPFSNNVAISVERVPRTLNELLFTFDATIDLSEGYKQFTLAPIIDAYGLKTELAILKPPTLDMVEQIANKNNHTILKVTFSDVMKGDSSIASATNINNYTLQPLVNDPVAIPLLDIEPNTNSNVFEIEVTSELIRGDYILYANGIENIENVPMIANGIKFTVVDQSVPTIERIIGTKSAVDGNDSILIMFNETMQTGDVYGFDIPTNYLLDTTEGSTILESSKVFKDNMWVRLSANKDLTLDDTTKVHIGYTDFKDIHYVKNISGIVYPLCATKTIEAFPSIIDISAHTSLAIVALNKVRLSITVPDVYFDNDTIDSTDFTLTFANGTTLPVLSLVPDTINFKYIDFIFDTIFDSSSNFTLTIANNPSTTDILARKIAPSKVSPVATNELRTSLKAASIVNFSKNTLVDNLTIALNFSDKITPGTPKESDFIINTPFSSNLKPSSVGLSAISANIVTLDVSIFNPENKDYKDTLTVQSNIQNYLYTSSNGKKIQAFNAQNAVGLSNISTLFEVIAPTVLKLTLNFDKAVTLPVSTSTAVTGDSANNLLLANLLSLNLGTTNTTGFVGSYLIEQPVPTALVVNITSTSSPLVIAPCIIAFGSLLPEDIVPIFSTEGAILDLTNLASFEYGNN